MQANNLYLQCSNVSNVTAIGSKLKQINNAVNQYKQPCYAG